MTVSKKYLPSEKNLFSKHDLEIKIIDSVYTDGAPAIFGIYFCFVRSS